MNPEEEKETLRSEGFAEKDVFKPGMKELHATEFVKIAT